MAPILYLSDMLRATPLSPFASEMPSEKSTEILQLVT
jgi:hypothetical protein